MNRLLRAALPGALLLLLLAPASSASALETIHLIPDDQASWSPTRLFAWFRPSHNFGERSILVETSPPGAMVDLFYVRANFQKRYEQAESPVKVILPHRVQAGPRDAVKIRAFLEGYRQAATSVRVNANQDKVVLALEPLPNLLVAASHIYFAGRGSFSFLTKEPLQVRVQEETGGFNIVLGETAKGPDVDLTGVSSPLVSSVEALQLGEDLMVRVKAPEAGSAVDLRSRQSLDELRDLYVYSVELVPKDDVAAVRRAREALASLRPSSVSGCARVFDERLRGNLDAAALSRALAPRGAFTDAYLRAAMKRLGELSASQRISMIDGSQYDGRSGIELAAAMSQPGEAIGYLALLRAFVGRLEDDGYRTATLRALIAPEVGAERFAEFLQDAEAAEATCIAAR